MLVVLLLLRKRFKQAEKLSGRQDDDPQLLRLLDLAAGVLAAYETIRLFRDGVADDATLVLDKGVDALAGVRVHLAGDYDCHAVNGAFSSGRALCRLLRRRHVQDLPHLGPEIQLSSLWNHE